MDEMPSLPVNMMFSNPLIKSILVENGFTLIDFKGRSVIASEIWHEMGLTEEDFLERRYSAAIHPSDQKMIEALYEKLNKGITDRGEGQFRFIAKNKKVIWLALTCHVIRRDEDSFPSIVMIHDTDITELINAQEEIRERLVEIESLKELLFGINQSLDFNETISKIIELLQRIIPFDSATVQALDGGVLHIIGSYGYPETVFESLTFPVRGIDNPASRAVTSRRPIICNDVEHDFKGFVQVENTPVIKSWLGIPLIYEDRAIGLFALDSAKPGFYTDRHVRIASNVAEHISIAVEHARQHTKVKEEARTDKLTGIANRYGLETIGQEIFNKAGEDDVPLGVLMIDIDNFKDVNDAYGHAYGDQVLRIIVSGISRSLRSADYLVRYGGEEFVILLPNTSTREALVVAERLRQGIPRIAIDVSRACPSVSIGVFSGVPSSEDLLHEFIRRADLALYEAKSAGRNRCRVWGPNPEYFDKQGSCL